VSDSIAARPVNNDWFIWTNQRAPQSESFLDIDFADTATSVMFDVIANPSLSVIATAFDTSDNLLGTVTIPSGASTWIAGSVDFRSLSTPVARVHVVTSSPFASASGIDNLSFSAVPAPEPSTLAMMALGIAGIGFARKRKQA